MRGVVPDVVTDQTPAHNLHNYVPNGMSLDEAYALLEQDPETYAKKSQASIARHVQAMLDFQAKGAEVFDYGNNIRQRAFDLRGQRCF